MLRKPLHAVSSRDTFDGRSCGFRPRQPPQSRDSAARGHQGHRGVCLAADSSRRRRREQGVPTPMAAAGGCESSDHPAPPRCPEARVNGRQRQGIFWVPNIPIREAEPLVARASRPEIGCLSDSRAQREMSVPAVVSAVDSGNIPVLLVPANR